MWEPGGNERYRRFLPVARQVVGCLALGALLGVILRNPSDSAEADPVQDKPPKPAWLLLDYAGPRDESGPPLILYLDDAALKAAEKHAGRTTPRKAKISAEVMQRVVAYFRKEKLWDTPRKATENISERPFQFTFGIKGKLFVTNLEPKKAHTTLTALKNEVLKETPAAPLLAEFAGLYGWK